MKIGKSKHHEFAWYARELNILLNTKTTNDVTHYIWDTITTYSWDFVYNAINVDTLEL